MQMPPSQALHRYKELHEGDERAQDIACKSENTKKGTRRCLQSEMNKLWPANARAVLQVDITAGTRPVNSATGGCGALQNQRLARLGGSGVGNGDLAAAHAHA